MITNKFNVLRYLSFASILLLLVISVTGCNEDAAPTENSSINNSDGVLSKQTKVNVCHNGNIINVSINAVPGHQAHGDAVDMDGDGYFDIENDCAAGVDCDDNDPAIGACPTTTWNGPKGQCYTFLDVTGLVGVSSFIQLCQGSGTLITAFTLSTTQYNADLNCLGGYSPISGTVTVEQNGVVIEAAPRTELNRLKFQGNARKRGNIIEPSDDEIEIARRSNRDRILRYLR